MDSAKPEIIAGPSSVVVASGALDGMDLEIEDEFV